MQKGGAAHHPELAKLPIVTERSGSIPDGGVVLAWCPRHKTLGKLQHLENSVIVLVEWNPGAMAAWARLREAYNVVSGEVMHSGLAESTELLEGLVAEGYNGWTKSTDVMMTEELLGGPIRGGCIRARPSACLRAANAARVERGAAGENSG